MPDIRHLVLGHTGISHTHLGALRVPLVNEFIPYLYFIDIGSGQKVCSRRYQFVFEGQVHEHLPVVFQVEGRMQGGNGTRDDDSALDDVGPQSPVTAKASCFVGPLVDNDPNWERVMQAISRIKRAAQKWHRIRVQTHAMLVPDKNKAVLSIKIFWCQNNISVVMPSNGLR